MKINLIRKSDHIKGVMYYWECQIIDNIGNSRTGFIQADYNGENIIDETLEYED